MKRHIPTILAVMVFTGLALAGPIHTWGVGEVITSTDLNANFSHIHNTMVGGHGPRLVNSDISSGAAISHSKMATPSLLPKTWIQVDCSTTPGTCTEIVGTGMSAAYGGVTGRATLTFDVGRSNSVYGATVSAYDTAGHNCNMTSHNATTIDVDCTRSNPDAGVTDAAVNSKFTLVVMDDNN